MSEFFIIHDYSPSRPWLHALLAANAGMLAANGFRTGPFNPWSAEQVFSHDYLWDPQIQNAPNWWRPSHWAELAESAGSGAKVILFSANLDLAAHQHFSEMLRQETGAGKDAVKTLFILGNPVLSLEQRHREARPPDARSNMFAERCARLPQIIEHAQKTFGLDNVALVANAQETPVAVPVPEIAARISAFLGCPALEPLKAPPRHPLFFGSDSGRRLCMAAEVRFNSWPRLDEARYVATLLELDGHWGYEPASPLKQRLELNRAAGVLEGLAGLEGKIPPCPTWLAQMPETAAARPLEFARAREFAAALPAETRKTLMRRYANDEHLLSEDQGILFRALRDSLPDEFSSLGEPAQPVELTVLTMTYNHEKFIAQCLEGVLAQQTDFPVRHVVLDHCSTDGTAAIVGEYAKKHRSIRPVPLSRRIRTENVLGLLSRCRSKYAALCEGDDFFTEPLKLRKQVDWLEQRPHCALCFHPVTVLFEGENKTEIFPSQDFLPRGARDEYYLADLVKHNFIQTNSVVYRWRFRDGLPDWFRPDICPGDWYWHLLHAATGKIGFLREVMSTYRRHRDGRFWMAARKKLEHRRIFGMDELEAYKVNNDLFGGRYFKSFARLANGVFADFSRISMMEHDAGLFNRACGLYPDFARNFQDTLKAAGWQEPQADRKN